MEIKSFQVSSNFSMDELFGVYGNKIEANDTYIAARKVMNRWNLPGWTHRSESAVVVSTPENWLYRGPGGRDSNGNVLMPTDLVHVGVGWGPNRPDRGGVPAVRVE